MEALDSVLDDWDACRPLGAVAPARRLHEVLNCATERVRSSAASGSARQDAYALLEPSGSRAAPGPPLIVRMLRVDLGDSQECIAFPRFWQAMQELARRLGEPPGQARDAPLAEEAAAFRDALLRQADPSGTVPHSWLAAEAAEARTMSADEAAWAPLEEAVARLQTPKVVTGRGAHARKPDVRYEEASQLLLAWLRRLVDDYCRGNRAAKIRNMSDVASCSVREACFHLGARGWEVEAALLSFFSSAAPHMLLPLEGGCGWSSHGAKLRKNEVDCPICVEPYSTKTKPVVTHCCFQVLCSICHLRMLEPGGFHCPFCRSVEDNSGTYGRPAVRRRSPLEAFSGVLRVAGQVASETLSPGVWRQGRGN